MSAQPSVLRVSGLTVASKERQLVKDVSFSIAKGEMLALVGESGCGKSLTALSLISLLPKNLSMTDGSILFEDADLSTLSSRQMSQVRGKEIAYIPQEPMTSLNPVITIGEQIAEVLRRHGYDSKKTVRERVYELLELVGISQPERRYASYPHNFSGGMRQRVIIAMAMACEPRLLIADEPTTALDVTIQAQVMDLIDELRKRQSLGVLLITHDLGVVARWADRVAVMYAGNLVETAPVRSFYRAPQHPYSRGLLESSIASVPGRHYRTDRLQEIPGNVSSAAQMLGCPFLPRCDRAMEICKTVNPPLHEIAPGRMATCERGALAREEL